MSESRAHLAIRAFSCVLLIGGLNQGCGDTVVVAAQDSTGGSRSEDNGLSLGGGADSGETQSVGGRNARGSSDRTSASLGGARTFASVATGGDVTRPISSLTALPAAARGGAPTSHGTTKTAEPSSGGDTGRTRTRTGNTSTQGIGGGATSAVVVTAGGRNSSSNESTHGGAASGRTANSTGGALAAGGTKSGASGSNATGGSTPSTDSGGCTRELLRTTVEAYFKALAAHDPASLPVADNVKLTENGRVLKLGQEGLWKTAGALKYAHSAFDTTPELCTSVSQAVVPDGSTDIPIALRLKLQAQKIVEIEMIAVRKGDYKVSGSEFPSNTSALIASRNSVKWEESVPTAQRNTRDEIKAWIQKYFSTFPSGFCNLASDCKRMENGGGSFTCDMGGSCASGQQATGSMSMKPRLLIADEETGIGVGFTMFMQNTDMHMIKMYGGQVHAVSAILGSATASGWD